MICVIGAGIVGCASAYQLARDGHQVMLLDAAAAPGAGCSFANGAQLSYSYVEPLASPATLRALPRLLMRRDSPVRFLPTLDWRQYAWGLQFLGACRTAQMKRGTRHLLELSFLSRDTLTQWMSDGVCPIGFRNNGKLVLCPDAATMARQKQQMKFQAALGCEQQALDIEECLEKEPALVGAVRRSAKAFFGGVWTPSECVADAQAMCRVLVEKLLARGGVTRFETHVTGFVHRRGSVLALASAKGEIPCDAVVLAAGGGSARLAQALGEYLPVYPVRGYSLTLPMASLGQRPRVSVTDLGRKTVFAPLGTELRIAAAAEIGGYDLPLTELRFAQMRSAVASMYPQLVDLQAEGRPWSGLRPATPTSIPIIRRSLGQSNVYFNVGHGALGLTLAAGSAKILGKLMCELRS